MKKLFCTVMLATCTFAGSASGEVSEITITRGDGVGFLPLLVMEKQKTIEKHAAELRTGHSDHATMVMMGLAETYLLLGEFDAA